MEITFKTAFSNFIQGKDFQIFLNYTIVCKSSYTFYANQILGSFLIVTLINSLRGHSRIEGLDTRMQTAS